MEVKVFRTAATAPLLELYFNDGEPTPQMGDIIKIPSYERVEYGVVYKREWEYDELTAKLKLNIRIE